MERLWNILSNETNGASFYDRFSGEYLKCQHLLEAYREFNLWWPFSYSIFRNSMLHSSPIVGLFLKQHMYLWVDIRWSNQKHKPLFVHLHANKFIQWSLPFALVISLQGYRSGRIIGLPIGAPGSIDSMLFLLVVWEYDWANSRSRLPIINVGWLWVLFVKLH